MTNRVQFPGLGLEFEVLNVAATPFGFPIYWYGVLIGLGVFLAIVFVLQQGPKFGLDSDRMIDVIMVGLVSGVVGARLYYVVFVSTIQYSSFWDVVNLRDGGLAIYGGIIFGFLGALLACKWRKVPVLPMFDLVAMGFFIGQALGRWGNFFNQEAFGSNTSLPWGMMSPATTAYLMGQQSTLAAAGVVVNPMLPVHPTFLYESLWCMLGFVLLLAYKRHRRFNGEIALMYVMWYGLGRFFIEGLRTDSLMFLGLRISQVVAAASVLAALCVWLAARLRTAGKPLVVPVPPPRTARVKVGTDDGPMMVNISWPAVDKAPNKMERQQLAMAVLEAEAARKVGEADAPTAVPEQTGEDVQGSKNVDGASNIADGKEGREEALIESVDEAEGKDKTEDGETQ